MYIYGLGCSSSRMTTRGPKATLQTAEMLVTNDTCGLYVVNVLSTGLNVIHVIYLDSTSHVCTYNVYV